MYNAHATHAQLLPRTPRKSSLEVVHLLSVRRRRQVNCGLALLWAKGLASKQSPPSHWGKTRLATIARTTITS
eukprot:11170416-Lingulodinium_polyedra.AAC.1